MEKKEEYKTEALGPVYYKVRVLITAAKYGGLGTTLIEQVAKGLEVQGEDFEAIRVMDVGESLGRLFNSATWALTMKEWEAEKKQE